MTQLDKQQLIAVADRLNDTLKIWRVFEQKGDHIVFRVPASTPGCSSPAAGELMTFWRFDNRFAAERFRNTRVVNELMAFITELTETLMEPA